jgi:apolipoprotein D and lipocalin family protein
MKIWQRISSALTTLLTTVLPGGNTTVPDGVEVVTGFELDRYLGTWYSIARLDHRFERGLSNVSATYKMRDDGGVSIVNRGYKVARNKWKEATGKAYFVGDQTVGQLKVSFFGPFYGGYNIVELDKDNYQYVLISGPNRGYLWILARSPELDADILSALVHKARELNFPVDELVYVEHSAPGIGRL